jgi:signal transduction histidine kinase
VVRLPPDAGVDELIRLCAGIAGADPEARTRLAAHLGSDDVLAFVADDGCDGGLVPAPGFPSTVHNEASWRAFLSDLRLERRVFAGQVAWPGCTDAAPAIGVAADGAAFVAVGGAPRVEAIEALARLVPIFGPALRHARNARAEVAVAEAAAREATRLAAALDRTRCELERALSELERQARSLDEARARAEAAARAKDEFLAMLGHELRNPLAPISTALQLLRLRGEVKGEHEVIERQVDHLRCLVDDLLDVSRIASGKVALRRRHVDLAQAIARAVETVGPMLERHCQEVVLDLAPASFVTADPARLTQVLVNLLSNASKYSPDNTCIIVETRQRGDEIVASVRDHGMGIDPELLDEIFEPFVQAHRQD